MPSGIRRIHPHNKGESPRSMERYKKRIKTMAPTQLFTELHDINDEYLGGSAKMRLLIKHLQTGWTNHLTQLRASMSDGIARQRLLFKNSENIVENDEGSSESD